MFYCSYIRDTSDIGIGKVFYAFYYVILTLFGRLCCGSNIAFHFSEMRPLQKLYTSRSLQNYLYFVIDNGLTSSFTKLNSDVRLLPMPRVRGAMVL